MRAPAIELVRRIHGKLQRRGATLPREEGLTVLLVEQNVPAALAAAERGDVLQTSRIVAGRKPDLARRAYRGM